MATILQIPSVIKHGQLWAFSINTQLFPKWEKGFCYIDRLIGRSVILESPLGKGFLFSKFFDGKSLVIEWKSPVICYLLGIPFSSPCFMRFTRFRLVPLVIRSPVPRHVSWRLPASGGSRGKTAFPDVFFLHSLVY